MYAPIYPPRIQIGCSYLDAYSMAHSASTGPIWKRAAGISRETSFSLMRQLPPSSQWTDEWK